MAVIHVVGLGPGDLNGLPMGTYELLKGDTTVILRTRIHPVVEQLEADGMTFESFDEIYETKEDFSQVYREMADRLLLRAGQGEDLIYAVPGHPLVAELSVQHLLNANEPNVEIRIGPGQSFLDIACARLKIDPIDGLSLLDGTVLQGRLLNPCVHTLIAQIYQTSIAVDVKLTLMDLYPDDYQVTVLRAAGVEGQERIETVSLYELDRIEWLDHLTTVYIPPMETMNARVRDPWEAVQIVETLRSPDGCPWDRKQTHTSLRKYVIEEAFEVASAIDEDDPDHLADELGDLLLQVLLHAQIAAEEGMFSIRDVFDKLSSKLIRRHPHVFGDETAQSMEDVNQLWARVKASEATAGNTASEGVLSSVDRALPALMAATEVQKAAAKVGFDWPNVEDVLEKIKEEMTEFEAEMKTANRRGLEEEFGDFLFATVNLTRHYGFDAETLLGQATTKFIRRFESVEKDVQASAKEWSSYTLEELEAFWQKAKRR